MLDMELGEPDDNVAEVPSGGSQPNTPSKEGGKAKNKPRKKRHRQSTSNNAQNLTVTTTSPATKKPCFSDKDFPPLGNNAKNSHNKENLDGGSVVKDKVTGSTAGKVKLTPVSNNAVSLTPVSSDGQTGPSRIVMIKGAPSSVTASGQKSPVCPLSSITISKASCCYYIGSGFNE